MAKLRVEYRCGHEIDEVRFGGHYAEQLEQAKERLECPACYRAAQSRAVQAKVATFELPALTGSEKQITWAMDIRAKLLSDLKPHMHPEQDPRHATLWTIIVNQTEARWWIDRRDEPSGLHFAANVAQAEGLIATRTAS